IKRVKDHEERDLYKNYTLENSDLISEVLSGIGYSVDNELNLRTLHPITEEELQTCQSIRRIISKMLASEVHSLPGNVDFRTLQMDCASLEIFRKELLDKALSLFSFNAPDCLSKESTDDFFELGDLNW
ncbi:MAG: hypothetical protein MHPSP_003559, partial [Paramarteilia canceri]